LFLTRKNYSKLILTNNRYKQLLLQKTLLISKIMASITISCGPSHKSRRTRPSTNSLATYMPKKQSGGNSRRVVRVKRSVPINNRFAALAVDTTVRRHRDDRFTGPRPSSGVAVQGSWGKKLTVSSNATVEHTPSRPNTLRKVSQAPKPERKLTRDCAYCHDKEHQHHIRDCPILAEKNRKKAASSHKAKEQAKKQKFLAAEARIAEQVRKAQEQEQVVEVVEESSDSDSSDGEIEEFPALKAAIASGAIVGRGQGYWGNHTGARRVTFKDDSENLMKPPCETKVFNKEDAPSAISDEEEEEEILLKPSANAWKPRRRRTGMTSHERQLILDQIKEKEAELATFSTDSWADSAEIEELEEEIKELKVKIA